MVLGEAPWCVSCFTMFSWPINAATWMGVNPDYKQPKKQIWKLHYNNACSIIFQKHIHTTTINIKVNSELDNEFFSAFMALYHITYIFNERSILISLSYLSDCLQWRSMFQQQFHHLYSVLLTGNMKRCETVLLMWTQTCPAWLKYHHTQLYQKWVTTKTSLWLILIILSI